MVVHLLINMSAYPAGVVTMLSGIRCIIERVNRALDARPL